MQENSINIIEAHLIDRALPSDFYGERVHLGLVGYLRPEQKFPSFDMLIQQITADRNIAKSLTCPDNSSNSEELDRSLGPIAVTISAIKELKGTVIRSMKEDRFELREYDINGEWFIWSH